MARRRKNPNTIIIKPDNPTPESPHSTYNNNFSFLSNAKSKSAFPCNGGLSPVASSF